MYVIRMYARTSELHRSKNFEFEGEKRSPMVMAFTAVIEARLLQGRQSVDTTPTRTWPSSTELLLSQFFSDTLPMASNFVNIL